LRASEIHIRGMDFDISRLLKNWDYVPGQVVVRRFKAKDGTGKIQLRVDLGLLQMNDAGRPDGQRPFGQECLFDHYQQLLGVYKAEHQGEEAGFELGPEECSQLQLEALQYHHRYICLLQLEDFAAVERDARRNLAVFDFVQRYARPTELAWSLRQFEPQLLMILTRSRACAALKEMDFNLANTLIQEGIDSIRTFFEDNGRAEATEQSGEIESLEDWRQEILAERPLSRREKLELSLEEAVRLENYELAAKVRDQLRALSARE
jgi:aryl carrier-like protein